MTEPRRLLDDPDFLAETGCDLADEAFALAPPDLPAIQKRVVRRLAWRRALSGMVGSAGVLLMVGAVLHFGGAFQEAAVSAVPASTARVDPITPTITPTPDRDVPRSTEARVSVTTPVVAPPRGTGTPRTAPPVVTAPIASPLPLPGVGPVAALTVTPPATEPAPDARTGDLEAQSAAFLVGEDALGAGRPDAARSAYEAYLARWPEGAFAREARLGALQAEVARHDDEQVVTLADELLADPAFDSRHEELLSTRVAALVRLGRCHEALATEGLSRRQQIALRRACW